MFYSVIDWLKSFQLYSSQDSMVDFLSVCFAINTMFSFSKIQKRLLRWIWVGIEERIKGIRIAASDCSKTLDGCGVGEEEKNNCLVRIGSFDGISNYREGVRNTVRKWLRVFKYIFILVAVACVLCIVVSREPFLVRHPFRVAVFGLSPIVLFGLWYAGVFIWIRWWVFKKCETEAEKIEQTFATQESLINVVKTAMEKKLKSDQDSAVSTPKKKSSTRKSPKK